MTWRLVETVPLEECVCDVFPILLSQTQTVEITVRGGQLSVCMCVCVFFLETAVHVRGHIRVGYECIIEPQDRQGPCLS